MSYRDPEKQKEANRKAKAKSRNVIPSERVIPENPRAEAANVIPRLVIADLSMEARHSMYLALAESYRHRERD